MDLDGPGGSACPCAGASGQCHQVGKRARDKLAYKPYQSECHLIAHCTLPSVMIYAYDPNMNTSVPLHPRIAREPVVTSAPVCPVTLKVTVWPQLL